MPTLIRSALFSVFFFSVDFISLKHFGCSFLRLECVRHNRRMDSPLGLQDEEELASEGNPLAERSGAAATQQTLPGGDEEVMPPKMLSSPSDKPEGDLSEPKKLDNSGPVIISLNLKMNLEPDAKLQPPAINSIC